MINTNEILKKHGLKLTKSLGQNFLTDINVIKNIVEAGDISSRDLVLEVGPGIGAMTVILLEQAGKVVAVEIDKHLIPPLEENLGHFPHFELVHGDIMKVDPVPLVKGWDGPLKVVSNLPYYITTPILFKLLESEVPWDTLVFMVQKEVAQRMAALPGKKEYGSLSIAVRYHADPKLMFTVSKNCFVPKPDVDSAVVRLKRRVTPLVPEDERENFFRTVKAAFSQRRKTLVNSLGIHPFVPGGREGLKGLLAQLEISENARAEELSPAQFVALARLIARKDV